VGEVSDVKIIDLSVPIGEGTKGPPSTNLTLVMKRYRREPGFWLSTSVDGNLHMGAHVDAALHVLEGGATTAEIPLEQVIGNAVVLDLSWIAPHHLITPEDLRQAHQRLRAAGEDLGAGDIILVRTDWSDRTWGTSRYFLESPSLSHEGAGWLMDFRPKALGFDCFEEPAAKDPAFVPDAFVVHRTVLGGGAVLLEGLTGLGQLPRPRVPFFAAFHRILGTEGAWARFFAVVDDA